MLWTDKYRPKDLQTYSTQLHPTQSLNLLNLTKSPSFPHLLIHGPMGAGKKTLLLCLLRQIYGNSIDRIKNETMHFTTPSNKKLEISALCSNHHIEINPSDVGIYDRVVVMELIKNAAQTQQLNTNASSANNFKIIVLTDVELLTKDAQHALRRTMEKYVSNCRIILLTTSISNVIPPIRSRCLCIRIPAPTQTEIVTILNNIASKEGGKLPNQLAKDIADKSSRNLRQAILMLQTYKTEFKAFDAPNGQIRELDWKVFIENVATKMIKTQNVQTLLQVRKDLYQILIGNIPIDMVFRILVAKLLEFCDCDLSLKVLREAAYFQHRAAKSNKEIIHLEAFVAKFMALYQQNLEDFNMDDFDF